jgi:hypothetical protein
MPFNPDIVVTGNDSHEVLLAVEAKTSERDFRTLAKDIRDYLLRMSCPTGLIVLPQKLYLYRNRYSGFGEDSVEEIGPFHLKDPLWRPKTWFYQRPRWGDSFEKRVQSWLATIARKGTINDASPELESAFETYLLPALTLGTIRAGGPRSMSQG